MGGLLYISTPRAHPHADADPNLKPTTAARNPHRPKRGYSQTQKEGLANLFSTLQPHVVAFGAAGLCASPARWVGTESGFAPYPCWSTVKSISDDGAGDPNGSLWIPAETDLCV